MYRKEPSSEKSYPKKLTHPQTWTRELRMIGDNDRPMRLRRILQFQSNVNLELMIAAKGVGCPFVLLICVWPTRGAITMRPRAWSLECVEVVQHDPTHQLFVAGRWSKTLSNIFHVHF